MENNQTTFYKHIRERLAQLRAMQKELFQKIRKSLEGKRIEKIKQGIYDGK